MQTPSRAELQVLRNVVVDVNDEGTITSIGERDGVVTTELGSDAVLLPGLVDTHIHAPQWPQLGTGLDLPLEQWLFEHTFPLEKKLTEPAFAATVWPQMVATLLAHGTTTAVYFATPSVETTTMLAATCIELGQRAFVGRVAMDHPEGTPDWYRDKDAAASIADSLASIEAINLLGDTGVRPIITPRFTPACSDEALRGLGELAADTGVRVQTHCSESDWQHGYAIDRFGVSDSQALTDFGLMRANTVLAHGDHLDTNDFAIIRGAHAGVAHCPLSNAYFANAVFPARRALDAGVMVGLGTDIAGGSSPGLLPQAAHAVTASRYLEDGVDPGLPPERRGSADSRLSIVEAFYLATLGGADLLGSQVGVLDVGRSFDALAVGINQPGSPLQAWAEVDDDARIFEKIVRLATPAEISDVWCRGRRVAGAR
jgi:guanine deaminase